MAANALVNTREESLSWVSARLARVLSYYPDDFCNPAEHLDDCGAEPITWMGFLGGDETNGMSHVEKRAAFDMYLDSLGTADILPCQTNSVSLPSSGGFYADEVEAAVAQCRVLNHTNAWSSLKALVLNPNGVAKADAIELVVKYGPVDDDMTSFVENIITNKGSWSRIERGSSACGGYASRLMEFVPTNLVQQLSKQHAIAMFYRHRKEDVAGAAILDQLFVESIEGYGMSSNRLDTAMFVLAHPEKTERNNQCFSIISNQLLSSGQPLRWINVGGNNP